MCLHESRLLSASRPDSSARNADIHAHVDANIEANFESHIQADSEADFIPVAVSDIYSHFPANTIANGTSDNHPYLVADRIADKSSDVVADRESNIDANPHADGGSNNIANSVSISRVRARMHPLWLQLVSDSLEQRAADILVERTLRLLWWDGRAANGVQGGL